MSTETFAIDRPSLLIDVDARVTLDDVERMLAGDHLTLGIADFDAHRDKTVAAWLSEGAPGAPDPWLDPADHLLAGLDATLPDGTRLSIRPAPRRSTGPDLMALAFGTRGRFMRITRAWLRVHPRDALRPETEPFQWTRSPPLTVAEEELLAAIEVEIKRVKPAAESAGTAETKTANGRRG
ncbi:hypothetical protein [Pendulispora albinea]|uniref:FAD-binding PCMH-type domain-containing protein n=1 Tax=Pendulispora albinea TaxID=2741071 RepID=A0ABZ2M8D6_9BACT